MDILDDVALELQDIRVLLVLTAGAAAAATAAQIGEVELQLLAAVGAKDAAIGQDVLIKEDFLFTVGAGGLVDLLILLAFVLKQRTDCGKGADPVMSAIGAEGGDGIPVDPDVGGDIPDLGGVSGDAEILKWLCARGYVAAGVNYTLFGEENP